MRLLKAAETDHGGIFFEYQGQDRFHRHQPEAGLAQDGWNARWHEIKRHAKWTDMRCVTRAAWMGTEWARTQPENRTPMAPSDSMRISMCWPGAAQQG
ncbi:MAG: hypothetical protein EBU81_14635, partial [Proteobacteria bacterium]|nr:hypothetical protein [Pseudomonadota bacterium]